MLTVTEITPKNNFPRELEKINTVKILIISFISPVLSSVSYELQTLFLTFGVVRNDFF